MSPNVRRNDSVEHGKYKPTALTNSREFFETPPGRCVVGRDDGDGSGGVLDRLEKRGIEGVPLSHTVVVSEYSDAFLVEFRVECVGEVVTRVFPSEAQEYVPPDSGRRRRKRDGAAFLHFLLLDRRSESRYSLVCVQVLSSVVLYKVERPRER